MGRNVKEMENFPAMPANDGQRWPCKSLPKFLDRDVPNRWAVPLPMMLDRAATIFPPDEAKTLDKLHIWQKQIRSKGVRLFLGGAIIPALFVRDIYDNRSGHRPGTMGANTKCWAQWQGRPLKNQSSSINLNSYDIPS